MKLLKSFPVALLLATAAASAQTSVNLRDADIRALIDDVSKATGAGFVIDPRVQGKVSIVSDRPLSRAGYFELFLATLRANGFVAVPIGNNQYRVQPAEASAATSTRPGGDRLVTTVVPLSSIDAPSAAETVRPLLSRSGAVSPNRAGNAIIIADFADNVARARAALQQIDRDRAAVRVVPLANAGARDLAQSLATLAGGGEGGRSLVTIVPVDASNALAIRGEPTQVARFAAIAQDLDRRALSGAEVRVIFLRHADASAVLPVLQTLVGQAPTVSSGPVLGGQAALNAGTANPQAPVGQNSGGAGGGGLGGAAGLAPASSAVSSPGAIGVAGGGGNRRAIIARYEGANAIIISAAPDLQRSLGEVVMQLDRVRPQVQVEAIIVELSDNAARRLGVQFLLAGTGAGVPFGGTTFSNATPNILALGGAIAAQNGVLQPGAIADAFSQAAAANLLGQGGQTAPTGGTAGYVGRVGSLVFGAIINAVRNDAASNVLSTPSIITLDNQPARILVGQEVPITTGEALGQNLTNAFRTTQRQDVGIQLAVKPQINAGGSIKLDIKQIVSSIATATVSSTDLILNKREIETSVTVEDGQILALGGLLDDNSSRSVQRVPLLGDIPGIGELFKSRTRNRTKTNLMVFIRPTIIKNPDDADTVTAIRWNNIRQDQVARDGVSSLDELARGYLCTTPPGAIACPVTLPPAPAAPVAPPPPPKPKKGERG